MTEEIIVIGIDGSVASRQGLSWAARQAQLTDDRLRAVTVWRLPAGPILGVADDFNPEADARTTLSQTVRDALGSGADGVEQVVVRGLPGPALVAAAADASLLVVGSRGHGELAGMLLGSVSQYCTTHAICPALVVPSPTELAHRRATSVADAAAPVPGAIGDSTP